MSWKFTYYKHNKNKTKNTKSPHELNCEWSTGDLQRAQSTPGPAMSLDLDLSIVNTGLSINDLVSGKIKREGAHACNV